MAQLRDGTANVTNGGQDVTFTGVDITGVSNEWLFYVDGDADPVYTIVAVFPGESPPRITLAAEYQGLTNATAGYALTRDFTPTWSLPLLYPGDIATRQLINRILAIIDPVLGTGAGGSGITLSQYQLAGRLLAGTGAATGLGPTQIAEDTTPVSGDFLLGWNASNVLVKYNIGNLPAGGGDGAIDVSGTPTVGQFARWVDADTLEGVAPPAGSLDVQGTPTVGQYARWVDSNTLEGVAAPSGGGLNIGLHEEFEFPEDKTYTLHGYAMTSFTINSLRRSTVSGTCTAAISINGTPVTGLSSVAISSTPGVSTATAANVVGVGARVEVTFTNTITGLPTRANLTLDVA